MARKAWNHRKCAEHYKVEGFDKKVCVLPGQDAESIVRFATIMGKLARAFKRQLLKPGTKRRSFNLHDVCGGHFEFPGMGKVCYGHKRMDAERLAAAKADAYAFAKEIGHIQGSNPRYARLYYSSYWS